MTWRLLAACRRGGDARGGPTAQYKYLLLFFFWDVPMIFCLLAIHAISSQEKFNHFGKPGAWCRGCEASVESDGD